MPCSPPPPAAAEVTALEIVEVGLFHARTTGHYPSPQAVNERTNILANVDFDKLTTKVPARLGIRFGTRFRVVGAPASGAAKLRAIWRIPEPGIQDPASGAHYRQSISDAGAAIARNRSRSHRSRTCRSRHFGDRADPQPSARPSSRRMWPIQ